MKKMNEIRNLKVLVVGFGSIGRRHTRILSELGIEDLRVCDPLPEMLAKARDEFGIKKVYSDYEKSLADKPDAVVICTPTALHIPQAIEAIEANADVLTEKPLSVTLEGIDELEKLAKEKQHVVMVAHCFRFHEGLLRAKQWVEEGRIGRLISIRALVGEYIPEVMPNYKNMYISKYSGVYELMHDIDLALWYASQRPVRVFGIDGNFSDVEMNSPDMVEMLIEFEDRCVASVHLDFFERARHRQMELLGTEGTIFVEFARWDKCVLSLYEAKTRKWYIEELETDRDDMFRAEDRTFLETVINRSSVPVDIREGRKVVEVMLAAQESARTKTSVLLKST
ncbi:MAG: Gfo/Idh/MocA family oxidoreductase [Armatimonadota bacterium]|nr:Gfo/Idh/MocA family oxidoreductase [Armatimonadota bacterium]